MIRTIEYIFANHFSKIQPDTEVLSELDGQVQFVTVHLNPRIKVGSMVISAEAGRVSVQVVTLEPDDWLVDDSV